MRTLRGIVCATQDVRTIVAVVRVRVHYDMIDYYTVVCVVGYRAQSSKKHRIGQECGVLLRFGEYTEHLRRVDWSTDIFRDLAAPHGRLPTPTFGSFLFFAATTRGNCL